MKRSAPLRRTPIRRKPSKVRAGAQPDTVRVRKRSGMAEARRESFGRSGGLCALCVAGNSVVVSVATDAHHRKLRSQGGKDEAANLLPVCSWHHHSVIHGYPEVAKEQGWIVPMWDVVFPWWELPFWTERRAS